MGFFLIILFLVSFKPYNVLLSKVSYDANREEYTALPNTGHASIQYGPGNSERVVRHHYEQNGYSDYTLTNPEPSVGIKDVVESVSALLDFVQTFPRLAGRKIKAEEIQPLIHGTQVQAGYQVATPMKFPEDATNESNKTVTVPTLMPSDITKKLESTGDHPTEPMVDQTHDNPSWTTLQKASFLSKLSVWNFLCFVPIVRQCGSYSCDVLLC